MARSYGIPVTSLRYARRIGRNYVTSRNPTCDVSERTPIVWDPLSKLAPGSKAFVCTAYVCVYNIYNNKIIQSRISRSRLDKQRPFVLRESKSERLEYVYRLAAYETWTNALSKTECLQSKEGIQTLVHSVEETPHPLPPPPNPQLPTPTPQLSSDVCYGRKYLPKRLACTAPLCWWRVKELALPLVSLARRQCGFFFVCVCACVCTASL